MYFLVLFEELFIRLLLNLPDNIKQYIKEKSVRDTDKSNCAMRNY